MGGAMIAEDLSARSAVTRMRPLLCLLLALSFTGCGAPDPGPEFTAPGSAATGGTTQVPPVPSGLQAAAGNARVMLTWMVSTRATA